MPRTVVIVCIVLAVASLGWCLYRDIQLEKQLPGDLRNRVVGARLQMDGRSPYFYNWHSADGIRYYDHTSYFRLPFSNVTSTPFFHQLLYPIANLPQRTISRIWLVVEYLALLLMAGLTWSITEGRRQRWAVISITLLFLYSYAWTTHIYMGQIYIIITLFAFLFYYFLTRKPTRLEAVLSGLAAAALLLVRPTAIFFLLPFLWFIPRYSKKYLAFLFGSFLVLMLAAFSTKSERFYWADYVRGMKMHVRMHQFLPIPLVQNEPDPDFQDWEGWHLAEVAQAEKDFHYIHNGEYGNVGVITEVGFHYITPNWMLSVACFISMAVFTVLFRRNLKNKAPFDSYLAALFGFYLYMMADIFTPIHRANYNAVQWLFPLLLLASGYRRSYWNIWVLGIIAGIIVNSKIIAFMPMQCSAGEYIIYASVLGLLLTYQPTDPVPSPS